MTGRVHVVTETYLPHYSRDHIVSNSSGVFSGDTPHESEIAGDAIPGVVHGHSQAHGIYLSSRERYRIRT